MQEAELVLLRLCKKPDCEYKVTNWLTDVKDILLAMSNHLAAINPALAQVWAVLRAGVVVAKVLRLFPCLRRGSLKQLGQHGGRDSTAGLWLAS